MGKVFIQGLVQNSGERVYCTLSALKHWDFGKTLVSLFQLEVRVKKLLYSFRLLMQVHVPVLLLRFNLTKKPSMIKDHN